MKFRLHSASLPHLLIPAISAFTPLIITPGLLYSFDIAPKLIALFLAIGILLCFCKTTVNRSYSLFHNVLGRVFLVLIAAQIASLIVSSALSASPSLSAHGSEWRQLGSITQIAILLFGLLMANWLIEDSVHVLWLLRALHAAGAVSSAYGIAQYLGRDPWLPAAGYSAGEGIYAIVRPPSTFGHADYFAAWLAGVFFVALACVALETPRAWRIAAQASAALAACGILLSGTRSAMLAVAAGLLFYWIAGGWHWRRVSGRAMALGAAAAALAAGFILSPAGAKLRARGHWALDDPRGGARLLLWSDSLRMVRDRPWIGYGPESFASEFPRYESAALARMYPDFFHESPHNFFLDAGLSQGLVGETILCGLLALGVASYRKATHPVARPLMSALIALLAAHCFMVLIVPTALLFYSLVALLVALVQPKIEAVATSPMASRFLLPVRVVAGLFFLIYVVRFTVCEYQLGVMRTQLEQSHPAAAILAYGTAQRWAPGTNTPDLYVSRKMAEIAVQSVNPQERAMAWQEAIRAGVRATTTAEDRQNAWYSLAVLAAPQNNTAAVEACLRNAISASPQWFKPHWQLARVLELTHREPEALAEASLALQLDGNHDREVAETQAKLAEKLRGPR